MAGGARSLEDMLADTLPKRLTVRLYHVSTPPTRCAAIFSAPPGAKPERTYCESHFLNVSVQSPEDREEAEVLIFAIEILVYTTKHLTTLFVAKADSTGYLGELFPTKTRVSPLRSIATTFVSYLLQHRRRQGIKVVVSLFARAQDQYLFPGSVENPSKHVSDDRQLIRWWCKVLDPMLREYDPPCTEPIELQNVSKAKDQPTSQAYLVVPGEDSISGYLPLPARTNPTFRKRWKHGDPLRELSRTPTAPPRCLIPHFPDDPKARYLDELDEELPDHVVNQGTDGPVKSSAGYWKSVPTLDQFWEMMAFRQECSSGRLVGFIWVVFTPLESAVDSGGQTSASQKTLEDMIPSSSPPVTPRKASRVLSHDPRAVSPSISASGQMDSLQDSGIANRESIQSQRRKLTGPIVPRLPRIKSGPSGLSTTSQPEDSRHYYWPSAGRGYAILNARDYKRANDLLLRLDFADKEAARGSSIRWIEEVAVLAGITHPWGRTVVGMGYDVAGSAREDIESMTTTGDEPVNMLQVRRRTEDNATNNNSDNAIDANRLSAGLSRKRPKTQEPTPKPAVEPGVNVLGAGLVRKKQKV